jgi:zinc/manganese transport system substrate-binding protein
MRSLFLALVPLLTLASVPVHAAVEIFACEPEWAALADEIGGDKVSTFSATTAFQDAHFIQARPSLLARVRRADLVFCTGANLEIGWLPVLLRQAANAAVAPGSNGFLDASQSVRLLDVPTSADRAEGDIHPNGNPHFQLDPRNLPRIAATLTERLQRLDSGNAAYYDERLAAFNARWTEALANWSTKAENLAGMQVIVHHSAWVYLEDWLGIREVGQMEPKPGLPPTASHLAGLLDVVQTSDVKAFLRASYQNPKAASWLMDRTDIPDVVIPHTVGATDEASDLYAWFDDIINRLLEVNR